MSGPVNAYDVAVAGGGDEPAGYRSRGARQQWIVPIDECYALVGLIRTRWRGFTGGAEVWEELQRLSSDMREKSI